MSLRPPDAPINLNIRGLSPSATVAINERSNQMLARGANVYKLGLGQSPFPVPDSVVAKLREHAPEKAYLPVKGLGALRDEVARYHRKQGVSGDGDDVLIGPGSKELMFMLQLVYYGDIIIPSPAWVSYAPQAEIIGRKVRWVHTSRDDDFALTADLLADICRDDPLRPRILILNYPSNPTGDSLDQSVLEELAVVARQHRVVVLSDEIYGELNHTGSHVSIGKFYPEGTILSSGLSKWCGAGGWRLGTFMFPKELRWLLDAMSVVASETYTSTSAPIQHAAVRAFQGGDDIDDYLARSRKILSALGKWCSARLRDIGARCPEPVGGFYLFPDFTALGGALAARGIHDSEHMCARLLDETGVAILPGSSFGRPASELTVRLAYVDFDGAAALEAVKPDTVVDEAFLRKIAPRTMTAVDLMCKWLT